MNKTAIKLTDYEFSGKNNPLFQISDDPTNKLVRVIELHRAEYLFDIDIISIKAKMHYINPELKIIVFSTDTKVEGKAWDIAKGDFTIKINWETFQPITNTEFDSSVEVSPENYPYELTDAYEQFKGLSIDRLMPLLTMFIASNDQKQLFDQ